MKSSFPRLLTYRGAGLGNEVLGLGKAYLGAKVLGLDLVQQPWRINPRKYHKDLKSPVMDNLRYLGASLLPCQVVTAEMYSSTGVLDYAEALDALVSSGDLERGVRTAHASGMHGGYSAIQQARPFLQSLVFSSNAAQEALKFFERGRSPRLRLGVHYRRGDFSNSLVERGDFNIAIGAEWYVGVIENLQSELGLEFDLFIATDAQESELTCFSDISNVQCHFLRGSTLSDIAVLAECDAVICSVSSFSMLAVFLSEAPYIWPEQQLTLNDGYYSLWGNEIEGFGSQETLKSIEVNASNPHQLVGRGYPGSKEMQLAPELIRFLKFKLDLRDKNTDFIYYGAIKAHE